MADPCGGRVADEALALEIGRRVIALAKAHHQGKAGRMELAVHVDAAGRPRLIQATERKVVSFELEAREG